MEIVGKGSYISNLIGQITGGLLGLLIAKKIAVPKALIMEQTLNN